MADVTFSAVPLASLSTLKVVWFNEIPIDGILESFGEITGAKDVDQPVAPLESVDELLCTLGAGFNGQGLLESSGELIGNFYHSFDGALESLGEIRGSLVFTLPCEPLESQGEILGKFIREILIEGILESTDQLLCSNALFVTSNQSYITLSDGQIFVVMGVFGCCEISAIPIISALESVVELVGDVSITGDVTISWGTLESFDEFPGEFIKEVNFPSVLESIDEISGVARAEYSAILIGTPLISRDAILGGPQITNQASGYVMHYTDVISFTRPLDIIKLKPKC